MTYPQPIAYGDIAVGMHVHIQGTGPGTSPVVVDITDWIASITSGMPVGALTGLSAPDPANFTDWTITYELLDEPGSTAPPTLPPVNAVVVTQSGAAYQRIGTSSQDRWVTVGSGIEVAFSDLGDVTVLT